jgi:putative DNA primase/helicase
MPKGEYEGYCYYIPSGLLQWNEKNHTVRISLPEDFVVSLLNRQAEQEDERKVAMGSENFIALVKDKTADDYPTYQKPSETKVDKFSATEERLTRSVPQEMKERANWVIVRTRLNEEKGKVEKFLISPITSKFAEADAPQTWTDFDTACKYARENGGVALAYALDGKDQIACIDLDNCYNEEGMPTDIAKAVLGTCGQTYTERSVSGKGLHVFGKTAGMDLRTFSKDGDMEFYQKSHFIAMTGDSVSCSELASFDAPEAKKLIESKCERRVHWNGTGAGVEGLSRMSDRELVEKAGGSKNGSTFKDYYNGKDLKNNHSNSDMAFMNLLAFWCNGDKEQMLRIFATSGLYRPDKHPSYYECTAIKAIQDNTERFNPKKNPVSNKPTVNSSNNGKGGK